MTDSNGCDSGWLLSNRAVRVELSRRLFTERERRSQHRLALLRIAVAAEESAELVQGRALPAGCATQPQRGLTVKKRSDAAVLDMRAGKRVTLAALQLRAANP